MNRNYQLGDARLEKRLDRLVERFSQVPAQSIPQVFGEWSDTKAAYRFFANPKVTHEALVAGQREETRQRIKERGEQTVLMVQDTTSFDFKHHPNTEGMGPLDNEYMRGFWAHSTLAVSAIGVPIGLWKQQVWVRDEAETGKRHQRHQRAFEEKESHKWVEGLPEAKALGEETRLIGVCDREAHIYEFFAACVSRGLDFIVRASKGRSFTTAEQPLFAAIAQQPAQAEYILELKRRPDREARQAQVEIRFARFPIREANRADTGYAELTLGVVEVREPHPPPGEEAVQWVLLTTLSVDTLEQAYQVVEWYSMRWLIERFHYVLKSGCRLEERQLSTRLALERLLGVFNLVAWRLLWLTHQARQTPDASCLLALSQDEWQALYAHIHQTASIPELPPTLRQATRWIAQLGGFLGRKSDGEPGAKVLWRGWMRLQDIVVMWHLAHPAPQDVGNV